MEMYGVINKRVASNFWKSIGLRDIPSLVFHNITQYMENMPEKINKNEI